MTTTATNGTTPPTRPPLSQIITRGKIVAPLRVLLYGTGGVGKSTFAASAPDPIFLPSEDGTDNLDVARLPIPNVWNDALASISQLLKEQHSYKTLVIDTVSWLEPLIVMHICRRDNAAYKSKLLTQNGTPNMEGYNYNHGWTVALNEWTKLISGLDMLRKNKGMHIILLAHHTTHKEKNPGGNDYQIIGPKLHRLACDKLVQWSDEVLYAEQVKIVVYEAKKVDEKNKVKVDASGLRQMHTENRGSYMAKNRHALPEKLPLSWDEFYEYVRRAPSDDEKRSVELRARINQLLVTIDDKELTAKMEVFLGNKHPVDKLAECVTRLTSKVEAKLASTGVMAEEQVTESTTEESVADESGNQPQEENGT